VAAFRPPRPAKLTLLALKPRFGGASLCCATSGEHGAREELAILLFVKPRALDVEEFETGNEPCESEGVNRELGERTIRSSPGLIIEDVHRAVAHLEEINVAGDRTRRRRIVGNELDAMVSLQRAHVVFGRPHSGMGVA
jgi:hypothetical protein